MFLEYINLAHDKLKCYNTVTCIHIARQRTRKPTSFTIQAVFSVWSVMRGYKRAQ
jgi:hypothetical protein